MKLPQKDTNNEHEDEKGKVSRKMGIGMFFILLIVMIGLATFAYLKSQGMDFGDIGKTITEFLNPQAKAKSQAQDAQPTIEAEYTGEVIAEFTPDMAVCAYKEQLVLCTEDAIRALDSKGVEVWSIPVQIKKPLLKSNGSRILLADLEGKSIFVLERNKIVWQNTVEGRIINADINKSGHVAVVHEVQGYKGMVRIYHENGKQLLSRYIAHNFVMSAMVSPTAKQLLINSISVSGIKANTLLEFFVFEENPQNPVSNIHPRPNEIFPFTLFLEDDSFFAVSEQCLIYYDKDRNEQWAEEIGPIYSLGMSSGKYAVLAVAEAEAGVAQGATSQVFVYNTQKTLLGTYSVEGVIENLRTVSDVIAVNVGREAYFTDVKGKHLGKYTVKADILDIVMLNRQMAAIVTKAGVYLYKLGL